MFRPSKQVAHALLEMTGLLRDVGMSLATDQIGDFVVGYFRRLAASETARGRLSAVELTARDHSFVPWIAAGVVETLGLPGTLSGYKKFLDLVAQELFAYALRERGEAQANGLVVERDRLYLFTVA